MGKTTTEMKLISTAELIPYVNNARTHSSEQINKLRSSLREFGFINPVIIDRERDCRSWKNYGRKGRGNRRSALCICRLSD